MATILYIHSGKFHCDDVACVALMRCAYGDVTVHRVASVDGLANDPDNGVFIADIGGGMFDHHQPDARLRADGSKYAACGLLLEWLVEHGALELHGAMDDFLEKFILPIELQDNYGAPRNPLSEGVVQLNQLGAEGFESACDMLTQIFRAYLQGAKARADAKAAVLADFDKSDGKLVVLDRFQPGWLSVLAPLGVMLGAYPSNRGGWNLQVCSLPGEPMPVVLPASWSSDIEECTFVHANGFLAAFSTKEAAVKAAGQLIR